MPFLDILEIFTLEMDQISTDLVLQMIAHLSFC